MSSKITLAIIIILSALLMTGATYFVKSHKTKLSCMVLEQSNNPNAGAIPDRAGEQPSRGFPEWFYREAVPAGCEVPDTGLNMTQDADISSQFRMAAVVHDFAFWGIISGVLAVVITSFRNRGKA